MFCDCVHTCHPSNGQFYEFTRTQTHTHKPAALVSTV